VIYLDVFSNEFFLKIIVNIIPNTLYNHDVMWKQPGIGSTKDGRCPKYYLKD